MVQEVPHQEERRSTWSLEVTASAVIVQGTINICFAFFMLLLWEFTYPVVALVYRATVSNGHLRALTAFNGLLGAIRINGALQINQSGGFTSVLLTQVFEVAFFIGEIRAMKMPFVFAPLVSCATVGILMMVCWSKNFSQHSPIESADSDEREGEGKAGEGGVKISGDKIPQSADQKGKEKTS